MRLACSARIAPNLFVDEELTTTPCVLVGLWFLELSERNFVIQTNKPTNQQWLYLLSWHRQQQQQQVDLRLAAEQQREAAEER